MSLGRDRTKVDTGRGTGNQVKYESHIVEELLAGMLYP